tara:strand:- start:43 stop:408 length:366 start_codon:yes stop_codon:yes gene_type:complete
MVAEKLEELIKIQVEKTLEESEQNPTQKLVELPQFIETDSLGETVEKLAILHIRTWMLEDAIQAANSDKEIADLKRKIDVCFKIKRPKYVAAINSMIDNSIKTGRSLQEDSVKLYKGLDNE